MCGLWGEMAVGAGCWDRSISAFCGPVRAQRYQLAPLKLSPAFLDPPGPLFLPYSWWEERLWSASPSEISGILAGALNPHHHPLTRLWWPPPLLMCSVITPWRMLGPGVDWPTPQS